MYISITVGWLVTLLFSNLLGERSERAERRRKKMHMDRIRNLVESR